MSRAERTGWIVGAIGLVLAALGWLLEPRVFPHAWLAALVFWSCWPLGSMALLLAHSLTGGRWGEAVRPGLMLGLATLPLLLPALLPVLLTLPALYPWARAGVHPPNAAWLNLPFFAGRGVVYLIAWFAIAALILRASVPRTSGCGAALARIAPLSLIVLALTFTFAAIDLTLSLEPEFVSSIYGMLGAATAGLLALSVATLFSGLAAPAEVRADLGKLLLALVVLWTYLDFMQLLIVWQSNLAHQAPWYVRRTEGFWLWVALLVAAMHFVLPFFLLIFPQVQRSRGGIAAVCLLLVISTALRCWWTVLPAAPRGLSWVDLACMAGLPGIAFGFALWAGRRPLPGLAGAPRHV